MREGGGFGIALASCPAPLTSTWSPRAAFGAGGGIPGLQTATDGLALLDDLTAWRQARLDPVAAFSLRSALAWGRGVWICGR